MKFRIKEVYLSSGSIAYQPQEKNLLFWWDFGEASIYLETAKDLCRNRKKYWEARHNPKYHEV